MKNQRVTVDIGIGAQVYLSNSTIYNTNRQRYLRIEGPVEVKVEDLVRYVEVWFLPDSPTKVFNVSPKLYTYIDPWEDLEVGDIVLAGYKDAPAKVMAVDVDAPTREAKEISARLRREEPYDF